MFVLIFVVDTGTVGAKPSSLRKDPDDSDDGDECNTDVLEKGSCWRSNLESGSDTVKDDADDMDISDEETSLRKPVLCRDDAVDDSDDCEDDNDDEGDGDEETICTGSTDDDTDADERNGDWELLMLVTEGSHLRPLIELLQKGVGVFNESLQSVLL